MGSLLFLTYINDIANIPNLDSSPRLFADDTNVFFSGKDPDELMKKGNATVKLIQDWMTTNKLCLNSDKTCFIIFNRSQFNNNIIRLYLNGVELTQVTSVKFLGVTMDERLSWKNHIQEIQSSLINYSGIFYKIRNKIPQNVLKNLYFATVYPKLLYAIEIYANTCPTYLTDLKIINNKLLRILQNKPKSTCIDDLYKTFNTLPVDKLFQFKLLQFAHKLIYSKASLPSVYDSYFNLNSNVHSYNTRIKADVHINRSISNFGSRHTDNKCAILWNSLPDNIKHTIGAREFNKKIKSNLLT